MAFALLSRAKRAAAVSPIPKSKRKSVLGRRAVDSQLGSKRPASSIHATSLPIGPVIQTKLKIGEPNDKYEQEADRVSDMVMGMAESKVAAVSPPRGDVYLSEGHPESAVLPIQQVCTECTAEEDPKLQREVRSNTPANPCISILSGPFFAGFAFPNHMQRMQRRAMAEEDWQVPQATPLETSTQRQMKDEEDILQTNTGVNTVPEIAPGTEALVRSLGGRGHVLPPAERAYFEPRFGLDLSRVRVHTESNATATAHELHARAYTTGQHIVFAAGEYAPGTPSGRKLLAHELTHVIQQGGAAPSALSARPQSYAAETTSFLADLDRNSAGTAPPLVQRMGAPSLQRLEIPEKNAVGGCGVCYGGDTKFLDIGKEAHKLIEAKFVRKLSDEYTFHKELPFTIEGGETRTPDLIAFHKRTGVLRVGEIKPFNVRGLAAGTAKQLVYLPLLQEILGKYLGEDLGKDMVATLDERIGPLVGQFPDPLAPASCPFQILTVMPPLHGVYMYNCLPPFKELKPNPDCKCEEDEEPPEPPVLQEQEQEQDERKRARERSDEDEPDFRLPPWEWWPPGAAIAYGLAKSLSSGFPTLPALSSPGLVPAQVTAGAGGGSSSARALSTHALRSGTGASGGTAGGGSATATRAASTSARVAAGGSRGAALVRLGARAGLIGVSATITLLVFDAVARYTYGNIYESTRGWRLKEVYKHLGAVAEKMGHDSGYITGLLWAIEQTEQPDAKDNAILRTELFDALYQLRRTIYETGKALRDAANGFSAIRDQLDLSDSHQFDVSREIADELIASGSQSYSDLGLLHFQLSSMVDWLFNQVQRLVDNHRTVFKQDGKNWLARRR